MPSEANPTPYYRTFEIKVDWSFFTGFCWGFGIAAATAGMVALLVVLA